MAESQRYWRIETQSEGVRDFYSLKAACEYSYNAPLILRIEERLVGDQPHDRPVRRVDSLGLGDLCSDYWPE